MNSILAVEKGLPPGLWLPTAEESTEQYLTENFNHGNHDYEDIVDYGAFIVSLAALGQAETGRVSLMPRTTDFNEMHEAGYGISINVLIKKYGGLMKLQRALGFYPDLLHPEDEDLTKDEVRQRLKWVKEHAYPLENDIENITLRGLMHWGSERHLLPSVDRCHGVLGSELKDVRRDLGMEKRDDEGVTLLDMFRFGAKVLRDYDGKPPIAKELDQRYEGTFNAKPYETIRRYFKTSNLFWMEFDLVTNTKGFKPEELVNIGVRWAIQHGGTEKLIPSMIDKESAAMKLPSRLPIAKYFHSIPGYRGEVQSEYEQYLETQTEFEADGVSPDVFEAACRRYEAGDEFRQWLKTNIETLQKLSVDNEKSKYVLTIMRKGFDLLDESYFDIQMEDFMKYLKKLGIQSEEEIRFIFTVVPRLNADEVLEQSDK